MRPNQWYSSAKQFLHFENCLQEEGTKPKSVKNSMQENTIQKQLNLESIVLKSM